ncbi:DNA repair exonuclease SbcCD nuclease subunit [Lachnospiraceae bacterium C10]|nr:DNA repair exonuclease SbcCD nuclease subunit [Lachnospiraceae bacterium C10]
MKILHCADLHLDSKMESNLSAEQARQRREEMLDTFRRMLDYGQSRGVKAVLMAGDLFDKQHIRKVVKEEVKHDIISHPGMDFYFLRGNHDVTDFLEDFDEIPKNLKLFSKEQWMSYTYPEENIVISGRELDSSDHKDVAADLVLDQTKVNIVMLHGQTEEYEIKDKSYSIDMSQLRGRYIDYLALGHIHSYRWERLDERGVFCYPGCLEGRGFDETGRKGFVILEIDQDGVESHEFVSLAQRQLQRAEVEVEPSDDMTNIIAKIENAVRTIAATDLVSIVLTGRKSMDLDIDLSWIERNFKAQFFFFKVEDVTRVEVDYAIFQNDRSLKGTFVRVVQSSEKEPEERKAKIIEMGIRAIMEGGLE